MLLTFELPVARRVSGGSAIATGPVDSARARQIERSRELASLCARTADGYRGQKTVVLDLTAVTPVADFFVITSATSGRLMHAIADEIERVLREQGSKKLGIEGYEGESWVLQDYGDIVLHIFTPEARQIYDLERLWADAVIVDWKADAGQLKSPAGNDAT